MVTNVTVTAPPASSPAKPEVLTANQEQFCALIAAGYGSAAAYRGSFSWENMTAHAVVVEASRLKKQPKILARIAALRAASRNANEEQNSDNELAPPPAGTVAETIRLVERLKTEPDLLHWDDKRAKQLTLNAHLGQLARIRDLALARGHHRVALAAECERASYGKLRGESAGVLQTLLALRARHNEAATAHETLEPPA